MDRRQLFQSIATTGSHSASLSEALPLGGGLNPYNGPWNYATAAHLLRRAMFGPTHAQIKQAVTDGLSKTMSKLLQKTADPAAPLNYSATPADPYCNLGESWVDKRFTPSIQGLSALRENSLYAWFMQNIFNEGVSLTEKMMMFWHNHFVVSDVFLANQSYSYLTTIRKNVLGDFKQMTKDITIDGAMLGYLNGNTNTRTAPNENYARELMELFTLGKGPLAGPGDYTTYTEDDILQIAKVLTGWVTPANVKVEANNTTSILPDVKFNVNPRNNNKADYHDTSDKKLSIRFNNAIIKNNNENEYKDLIEVIFKKREAATFICRKLYRYFVYYKLDQTIEQEIVEGLADVLVANNFNVTPVLNTLLTSDHFFSDAAYGALIRSPYEWFFNTAKALKMKVPSDYTLTYPLFLSAYRNVLNQNQAIFGLPSVAGWPAYYQEPAYHEIWINSVTYPLRYTLGTTLINKRFGFRLNGQGNQIYGADVTEYASEFDNPQDANILISDVVAHLLPQPIQQAQLDFLKSKLLTNMTEAAWTNLWNTYKNDPTNTQVKTNVENRLRSFLIALTSMPEYHLS